MKRWESVPDQFLPIRVEFLSFWVTLHRGRTNARERNRNDRWSASSINHWKEMHRRRSGEVIACESQSGIDDLRDSGFWKSPRDSFGVTGFLGFEEILEGFFGSEVRWFPLGLIKLVLWFHHFEAKNVAFVGILTVSGRSPFLSAISNHYSVEGQMIRVLDNAVNGEISEWVFCEDFSFELLL